MAENIMAEIRDCVDLMDCELARIQLGDFVSWKDKWGLTWHGEVFDFSFYRQEDGEVLYLAEINIVPGAGEGVRVLKIVPVRDLLRE
jgi:uncharacterized protein YjlB